MAVNSITTATPAALPESATKKAGGALDKDTFLKLLVEQLRHQDPTAPADSSEWTAQMAQFSTVEQLTNLATSTHDTARTTEVSQAVGLLGRTVSYDDGSETPATGVVQRVDLGQNGPTLTINRVSGISPADLSDVT